MKRNSIQFEITIPIIVSISILLGIYGLFSYSVKKNQMEKSLESSIKRTQKRLEKNVSHSLFDLDLESIGIIIRAELKNEHIKSIHILDDKKSKIEIGFSKNKNGIINESKNKKIPDQESKKIEGALFHFDENESESIKIGHYIISINKKIIEKELENEIIFFLSSIVLLDITIVIFITILLRKTVVIPLKNLSDISLEISRGNYSIESENKDSYRSCHEINVLTLSMNNMSKKVETLTTRLKDEVYSQSKEIKSLLDNMNKAIFAIGRNFKVLPPVSKFSETIFGEDIVGKKVSEFLFYNIRKGTKEYRDLRSVFSIIFGSDDLQYFGLEDNLPKRVTLPDENKKQGKTLKLSYSPFYDKDNCIEKIMCTVEDVTESEEYLRQAEEDQEQYKYISEIINIENKEELGKKMELIIRSLFQILEDFVSPLSDTYSLDHFHKILDKSICKIQNNLNGLSHLEWKIHNNYIELEKFDQKDSQINPQVEAVSTTCDILETLLRCSTCINYFVPVNLNLNLSFTSIILEKIKDTEKIFKNLFEYVFLVREIDKIDEESLQSVVQVAKLYPDFERTIDLIQQRSRLLSFLLKGVDEEELSITYQKLSSKVKLMPERSRLTEVIIKSNLI
ncbi:hypothetical protein OAK75_13805, partial [Bacteriovoracales bacterium]|nr:hypothetical protein [Bacteriovoracales bacterium]